MSRLKVPLILAGLAGLFLTVFFATMGFLIFISQKAAIQIDFALSISQMLVGVAEVVVASAIGVEVAMGASHFLLKSEGSIMRRSTIGY
jgi:hypothetical protein